jgi:circadian clock protein KaiC
MRIVKYRGSSHGTNEYPTLIDESGLSILPISSLGLNYPVRKGRISSGIDRLDAMMGGKGYFRGSSILISGTAGLGKSSIAASFADRCCRDGLKCLYCSFEESPSQITRNMRSIGFNLDRWIKKGLLQLFAVRPTIYGLEMHLSSIHKLVQDYKPQAVVMDPITSMMPMGDFDEVRMMLTRAIDFLKGQNITTVFTSLTRGGDDLEQSEAGISSLMDTWLLLRAMDIGGERNRLIYILKSRGMAHSNQVREFQLTNKGIRLLNAYIGPGQVLTGSARVLQESKDRVQATIEQQAQEMRLRELLQQESVLQSQAQEIAQKLKNIGNELRIASRHRTAREMTVARENKELSRARYGD